MTRRVLVALGLLVALVPRPTRAEQASAALPSSAACENETTALGRAACGVAASLSAAGGSALVVVAAPASDERVGLPAALAQRLTQLVAARLGAAASASAHPLALPEAERAANAAHGLIYLNVALFRDRLELSADLYLGAGHFWQRVRSPGLHLSNHAFGSSPLDAELRALFPPIPLVVTRVDKATVPDRDIVALACGDVRGDGSSEIAMIGRRKVQVGHLEHGHFTARASLNWADYSAISASPLRDPLATGTVPQPGRLWVGSSDRADALDLSGTLQVQHRWHGLMPWPGGGCTHRVGLGYEGAARACPDSAAAPVVDFAAQVDAFASRTLASTGPARTLRVARPVGSESARALDSLHPEVTVPNVGAQLAVGDLDDDGQPEIVTSSPTLDRHADQLVVRTLTDNGQLRERWRISVPSGIDALAICPGDGRAMAPLALATGDGIWVVR